MTDGPAPKPKTPARSMATGCLIAAAIAVVVAGLAGFAFWKVSKGIDEIASIGSSRLTRQEKAAAAFGDVQRIERIPTGVNVQIRNDEGDATFEYQVTGSKASGKAWVWLIKRQGEWKPLAAKLSPPGGEVTIGPVPPPQEPGRP